MTDIIKEAIDATKDFCTEEGIEQTLDNLEIFIKPVSIPIESDLVERLREEHYSLGAQNLMRKAADLIESLEKALEEK